MFDLKYLKKQDIILTKFENIGNIKICRKFKNKSYKSKKIKDYENYNDDPFEYNKNRCLLNDDYDRNIYFKYILSIYQYFNDEDDINNKITSSFYYKNIDNTINKVL